MALEKDRPKRPRARSSAGGDVSGETPKKARLARVNDGEEGRDHPCPEESCGKRFKSKYAAKAHHVASHVRPKSHMCTWEGCEAVYTHPASLRKHLATHGTPSVISPSKAPRTETEEADAATGEEEKVEEKPYEIWKLWETQRRAFACPIHKSGLAEEDCTARFWRVYDVRRHLAVEHDLELEDEEVRRLLLSAEGEFLPNEGADGGEGEDAEAAIGSQDTLHV